MFYLTTDRGILEILSLFFQLIMRVLSALLVLRLLKLHSFHYIEFSLDYCDGYYQWICDVAMTSIFN